MPLLQCAEAKQNEKAKRAFMSEFDIQRSENSDKKRGKTIMFKISKRAELQQEQNKVFCSSPKVFWSFLQEQIRVVYLQSK